MLTLDFLCIGVGAALSQPGGCHCRLGFIIAEVIRTEREWWALLEGPWAGPEGMQFRQQWTQCTRAAGSVGELAQRLLELEAALRPVTVGEEWAGAAAANKTPAPSHAVSRAASAVDLAAMAGVGGGGEGQEETLDSRALAAAARAADPYDIRFEKLFGAGWEVNKRAHAVRAAGINRLPLAVLRRVRVVDWGGALGHRTAQALQAGAALGGAVTSRGLPADNVFWWGTVLVGGLHL